MPYVTPWHFRMPMSECERVCVCVCVCVCVRARAHMHVRGNIICLKYIT
jgi:hypothetical protein